MCYLYYCFTFESLPLSRTQCTRNMLMYMKALCTPRIINYGIGEDCWVEALRGAQGNQAVWISIQTTEHCSFHEALQRKLWRNIITLWKQWRTAHKHDCQNTRHILTWQLVETATKECWKQKLVLTGKWLRWEIRCVDRLCRILKVKTEGLCLRV